MKRQIVVKRIPGFMLYVKHEQGSFTPLSIPLRHDEAKAMATHINAAMEREPERDPYLIAKTFGVAL